MRPTSSLVAATLAVAALSSPVLAQTADCGPMAGGPGKFRELRAQRMEQHQRQLHDALKLSPEQEEGWSKFAATRYPRALPEGDLRDGSGLTAPERAERMLEFTRQQQQRLTDHVAALKTFYATLTPEQQKTFDSFHAGPRGGRGRPGGEGGRGGAGPVK